MSHMPHNIHQTWKTREVPSLYRKCWIDSWTAWHPDWIYKLWTDEETLELAHQQYPEFEQVFACSKTLGVVKSDFGRLLFVYEFGGVYADLDYQCLKNLEPLLDSAGMVVSRMDHATPYIHNAFFAAKPRHPLIWNILNDGLKNWKSCPMAPVETIAGPDVFTLNVRRYEGNDLLVAEPQTLCPISWRRNRSLCQRTLDDEFVATVAQRFPEAYAVTFWTHNWREAVEPKGLDT